MLVQPYLFLNGRCEEALKFYGDKLGAQVVLQMRFKDAPPNAERPVKPGTEDKIMHATLRIGTTELMASDGDCDASGSKHSGYSLSLTADQISRAAWVRTLPIGLKNQQTSRRPSERMK